MKKEMGAGKTLIKDKKSKVFHTDGRGHKINSSLSFWLFLAMERMMDFPKVEGES